MKIHSKLPEINNNVSHNKPFREFTTLLFGAGIFLVAFYFILDIGVDIGVKYISPKWEQKIFSNIFEDGQEDKKLQSLLDGLGKCANLPINLKLKIQEEDSPNAFAYPGGVIVVNDSLLKILKTQNALAFILAHEIGHFKNRDHLRMASKSLLFSLFASMLSGGAAFDDVLAPVAGAANVGYSKKIELQADSEGLKTLNCYYGHVGGANEFFEYIAKRKERMKLFEYFSSHPVTENRIENLKKLTKANHYKVEKPILLEKVQ